MIDQPGIYDISAADYHSGGGKTPAPSLSSSAARELLRTSPYHVNYARTTPQDDDPDEAMEVGTAVHAYLLEGSNAFEVINAPNYRTADAKAARIMARQAGKIPLLVHRWHDVLNMAAAALEQLQRHEDPPLPLTNGKPEQTVIWQEGDIWCRARLDWLSADYRNIDDLKSSRVPANPDLWARLLFRSQYDIQAAFYVRGLKAVTGIEAVFRFVVIEQEAPYRLSVIGLAPSAMALAQRKVDHAISVWRHCLETGEWPAYTRRTVWAEASAWEEARQLEREITVEDDGRPLAEQMFGGQA